MLKLPFFRYLLYGVCIFLLSGFVGLIPLPFDLKCCRPFYLQMCSSVYQLLSSGFSTSVNLIFFFFKCHHHLCSDFDIQENIFIFMPFRNLQCIFDKAVKCDNKNLFNRGTIVLMSVSTPGKVLLSLLILAVLSQLHTVFLNFFFFLRFIY